MNILYVNHYAGSLRHGMEFRPFYFARHWSRSGDKTFVVAASFSHLRTMQPKTSLFPAGEHVDGVEFLWLPSNSYEGNGIGRILSIFIFLCWLLLLAPWLAWNKKPAVVVASSTYPLDIFPCWLIARMAGARLVHEVHDLWPLTPMKLGGYSAKHPYIRLLQLAEDFACRHADSVVSILPATLPHLRTRGLDERKFLHVPNGVAVEDWLEVEPLSHDILGSINAIRNEGRFVLGYVGGHGLSNALDLLLEAAGHLKGDPVVFVFVGKGPEKAALEERARSNGLTNVIFLGAVSKRQVPALLKEFDALCLALHDSPLYEHGISFNKIYDYMMSGKPIVQAIRAANDDVLEAGCGLSSAPNDPEGFAKNVRKLSRLSPAQRAEMGERGKSYVLAHHTIEVLARRFFS